MTTPPRLFIDWVIVLTASALLASVATHRVLDRAMWGDEVRTWRDSVRKPYGDILRWQHNADHAPLGHLVTKLAADAFGTEAPWALRMPALLFGIAVVPLAYLLGRLAVGRLAGLLMAVMVCVDVTVTTQAHQVRMYTQFLAWTLAALCVAATLLREPQKRPLLKVLLLGLFIGLSVWTHFSAMALLLAALVTGAVLLCSAQHRRCGMMLLISVAIAAAICSQGLVKLYGMRGRTPLPGAGEHSAMQQISDAVADLMGNGVVGFLLFAGAMAGLYLLRRHHPRLALLLAVGVAVGTINLVVASHYRHIEGQRYLLGFLPACWVGLATLNEFMFTQRRRWLAGTFAALYTAGVIYQATRTFQTNTHPMADAMRRAARTMPSLGHKPGAPLIFAPFEPIQMAGKYYGFIDDKDLHRRINAAVVQQRRTAPDSLGRAQPAELWMLVVTPCRKKTETNTERDGIAAAQAAAGFFGHRFDSLRFPQGSDERHMSIVYLSPERAEIWSVDGVPR